MFFYVIGTRRLTTDKKRLPFVLLLFVSNRMHAPNRTVESRFRSNGEHGRASVQYVRHYIYGRAYSPRRSPVPLQNPTRTDGHVTFVLFSTRRNVTKQCQHIVKIDTIRCDRPTERVQGKRVINFYDDQKRITYTVQPTAGYLHVNRTAN